MSTPHLCLDTGHDYEVIELRLLNGSQEPIVACTRCRTTWATNQVARRGDAIVIHHDTTAVPDPRTLDQAADFTRTTGVDLLFLPHDQAVHDLTEALRLTREYVGADTLPAHPGWSWYDALARHAPDTLKTIVDTAEPPDRPHLVLHPGHETGEYNDTGCRCRTDCTPCGGSNDGCACS
ncbi:hypothetical protein [Nocardiopsis synnemataformans]|uniref:hypothetical protein n=1 Tax=Nocardiopsis synnemataformans TaxID=61305 RepID=UPI003EC0103C